MKTAEEWAKEYDAKFNTLDKEADKKVGEGVLDFSDIHEIIIREIQLDAYKAGMTEAADINKDLLWSGEEFRNMILTACYNKTTI